MGVPEDHYAFAPTWQTSVNLCQQLLDTYEEAVQGAFEDPLAYGIVNKQAAIYSSLQMQSTS
jgi:hypothetical protein